MHLRKQLAAIFSPTRRLDDPDQAVVLPGGRLGEVEWVVPRADCEYRRIPLDKLPARQRASAARIAARRHASGPSDFHVAWTGPVAHVWTRPAPAGSTSTPAARWIPESLLRQAPEGDGLRLLQQVQGFEGQYWRNGELQASQWWPQAPGPDAWSRFVRSCGLSPGPGGVPEPLSLSWSEPWGDGRDRLPASPDTLEHAGWYAVCGILALALGWQFAADVRWRMAQASVDSRIEALRTKAAPLLDARERAERAQDEIAALQALQSGRSDYALAASVIAPLPADARLVGWQREGEKLQAIVASAAEDPRLFVTAYADDPALQDVVATPAGNGTIQLAFDLPRTGAAE